jgi:HlyD family secretion protein
MLKKLQSLERLPDPLDFAPPLLAVQERPPHPLSGGVLRLILLLLGLLLLWAMWGKLDIVAVAEGRLAPVSQLKIVQPVEQGVIKEILVREGDQVRSGQVLVRMETAINEAETGELEAEFHRQRLTLRRVEAELSGRPLRQEADDPPELFVRMLAQHEANRRAYRSALDEQESVILKARHERSAAQESRDRLAQTLPHYRNQELAYEKLAEKGFAGKLMSGDKQRERIEREQEYKTQEANLLAAESTIAQAQQRKTQISNDWMRQLEVARVEAGVAMEKAAQALARQAQRKAWLELKAPQDGVVKDLASHTPGTVTSPGMILMTLVPVHDPLRAEVAIDNQDAGFVHVGQRVKLKLAPYLFQKYGMLEGEVVLLSADTSENAAQADPRNASGQKAAAYRAMIRLDRQSLLSDGHAHALVSGMQVVAEIHLGSRTVLEYLLSPVQKAFHEAAMER